MKYPNVTGVLSSTGVLYVLGWSHIHPSFCISRPFLGSVLCTVSSIGANALNYLAMGRDLSLAFSLPLEATEEERTVIKWEIDKSFMLNQLKNTGLYMGWYYIQIRIFQKLGECCDNRLLRLGIKSSILVLPVVLGPIYDKAIKQDGLDDQVSMLNL